MQVSSIGLRVPWVSASDPELAILMIKDDRQYSVLCPDYSNPESRGDMESSSSAGSKPIPKQSCQMGG